MQPCFLNAEEQFVMMSQYLVEAVFVVRRNYVKKRQQSLLLTGKKREKRTGERARRPRERGNRKKLSTINFRHVHDEIHQPGRIAPFIVIPSDEFNKSRR